MSQHPFAKLIDLWYLEKGPGHSRCRVTIDEKHLNPNRVVHGAVIFALADIGMGSAVHATLAEGELCATVEIKINYFKPVREGDKLANVLRDKVAQKRTLVAEVASKVPTAIAAYQERLSTKLREAVAALDEDRIRQEVGVFAAKVDVAEELARLITHLDEVTRVLDKAGAVGKRLDFLMQELNREANTLASKSVSGEVTAVALELKLLIEQMREQVQNLE